MSEEETQQIERVMAFRKENDARYLSAVRKTISGYREAVKNQTDLTGLATQNFLYTQNLAKRRLSELQVECREEHLFLERSYRGSTDWLDDGNSVAAVVVLPNVVKKSYFLNGRKTLTMTGNRRSIRYAMVRAKEVDSDEFRCPNCGLAAQRTVFIEKGCPYCRTKFNFSDFENRISSVTRIFLGAIMSGKVKLLVNCICIILGAVIIAAIEPSYFRDVFFEIQIGRQHANPILGLILLVIYVSMYAFMTLILASPWIIVFKLLAGVPLLTMSSVNYDKNSKMRSFKQSMSKVDPLFSLEYFLGVVDHRLKLYFFASDERILVLTNGQRHSSEEVVDVDILGFNQLRLEVCGGKLIVRAKCLLQLVQKQDVKLTVRKQVLCLVLAKNNYAQTDFDCNFELLRCKNCGGSISLLEGGKCKYCRTQLRVMDYDWILAQVSVL